MDNVCHTLVGAAIGRAGLSQRTRFGGAALMVAANLPDLDVLVFATDVPSVAFRRGWTHGALAQLCLPVLLTGVFYLIDRMKPARSGTRPVQVSWMLLLSWVGVISHVALDSLNNYGVRLLLPFDNRWFYGDTLFIVDPWLWLALGLGVWLTRRRADDPRPARRALLIATAYIVVMSLSAQMARSLVSDAWRDEHGSPPLSYMVGPVPVTPFRREVIVDAGTHYTRGTFTWLPLRVTFDSSSTPKHDDDPAVARAKDAPAFRGFLVWSRFPFWTIERAASETRVAVGDMRFAGRGRPFRQSIAVR